jgi:hypothetical protein
MEAEPEKERFPVLFCSSHYKGHNKGEKQNESHTRDV